MKQLREIFLLSELPDDELTQLANVLTWRKISPGEIVLAHLERTDQVYFLFEGALRLQIRTPDGRHSLLRRIGAGAHFGELAALAETPRSLEVVCETAGVVAQCSSRDFLSLVSRSPALGLALSRMLARRIISLTDRLFEQSRLEVRFRIYAELLRMSREGASCENGIMIDPAPTHDQIAASVGARREAVTREFGYLAQNKIIESTKGRITLLRPETLQKMLTDRRGPAASDEFDEPD